MATASDQLARLLTLIPWLVAHPGATKEEVARTFAITIDQLQRDLELAACAEVGRDTLASLDIDYWDDEITVLNAQTVDRPLQLRVEEAVTLLVGLRALAAVPGLADRVVVAQALAKVEEAIGESGSAVRDSDTYADGDGAAGPREVLAAPLQEALAQGRQLRLRYWTPARDEISERVVDPMRLVTVGTDAYLQGWCHTAEAVRTFRLDRIVEAEVLEAASSPPPQAQLVDVAQAGGAWSGGPSDLEVTLDLAPHVRWVVEYHPVESADELPGGGLRVVLRTPDLAWARRLVLRLAGGATVVAPAALRDDVARTAGRALAAYHEDVRP